MYVINWLHNVFKYITIVILCYYKVLISTEIASYLAPVGVTLMWSFNRALARIASSREVLSPRV